MMVWLMRDAIFHVDLDTVSSQQRHRYALFRSGEGTYDYGIHCQLCSLCLHVGVTVLLIL